MKILRSFLLFSTIVLIISSCKKEKLPEPTPMREPTPYYLRMTDAPAVYSAVNIDLQAVEVIGSGNTVMLNVNPGIYNLLNFSNGVDTLIATGSLYVDEVQQIRLILGPNNTLVKDNVTYPLSTPSAQQSGLKLQVHQHLQAGVPYYVLLDFDANQSIVEHGNGSYSLKPVIRTIETAIGGSIKGQILPAGIFASITATSDTNSYSSAVNANGQFILAGLPAGIYTVTIMPVAPYNPVTINNVVVVVGTTTSIGPFNM